MNRAEGVLSESLGANRLLVIAVLTFFIFATGRASPAQLAPELTIASP